MRTQPREGVTEGQSRERTEAGRPGRSKQGEGEATGPRGGLEGAWKLSQPEPVINQTQPPPATFANEALAINLTNERIMC